MKIQKNLIISTIKILSTIQRKVQVESMDAFHLHTLLYVFSIEFNSYLKKQTKKLYTFQLWNLQMCMGNLK